jgi:putative SOS response-associated peptidase YedK
VEDTPWVSYVTPARLLQYPTLTCPKRAAFVRHQIQQQGLQVDEAPDDDAVRETFNFAPGSFGLVYRAQVSDRGYRAPEDEAHDEASKVGQPVEEEQEAPNKSPKSPRASYKNYKYKFELKAMKWGLIPFWTKRSPDYGSMLKTINCRDDSLMENRGMWNTMKQRKRCLVICQGFYEWLKKGAGGKEKIAHYVKRKDGQLMCFAGLWDCVQYEDSEEKLYTYTIITTDSNPQLKFLHDRMPVILEPGSWEMKTWLDPERTEWSISLQNLLKPYKGELECYPVNKEVGKVGNNSPDFIIPIDSKVNKKNIANFFANSSRSPKQKVSGSVKGTLEAANEVNVEREHDEQRDTEDHQGSEHNAPLPVPSQVGKAAKGTKRQHSPDKETPKKASKPEISPRKSKQARFEPSSRKTRSAMSKGTLPRGDSPRKAGDASHKITDFFGK